MEERRGAFYAPLTYFSQISQPNPCLSQELLLREQNGKSRGGGGKRGNAED